MPSQTNYLKKSDFSDWLDKFFDHFGNDTEYDLDALFNTLDRHKQSIRTKLGGVYKKFKVQNIRTMGDNDNDYPRVVYDLDNCFYDDGYLSHLMSEDKEIFKDISIHQALLSPVITQGKKKGKRWARDYSQWARKVKLSEHNLARTNRTLAKIGELWASSSRESNNDHIIITTDPRAYFIMGHTASDGNGKSCYAQLGDYSKAKIAIGSTTNSFMIMYVNGDVEHDDLLNDFSNYDKIKARCWGFFKENRFFLSNAYARGISGGFTTKDFANEIIQNFGLSAEVKDNTMRYGGDTTQIYVNGDGIIVQPKRAKKKVKISINGSITKDIVWCEDSEKYMVKSMCVAMADDTYCTKENYEACKDEYTMCFVTKKPILKDRASILVLNNGRITECAANMFFYKKGYDSHMQTYNDTIGKYVLVPRARSATNVISRAKLTELGFLTSTYTYSNMMIPVSIQASLENLLKQHNDG